MVKLLRRLREMYPTAEITINWLPGGDTTSVWVDDGKGRFCAGSSKTLIGAMQKAVRPVQEMPF